MVSSLVFLEKHNTFMLNVQRLNQLQVLNNQLEI